MNNNIFIPISEINDLRRNATDELNKVRLYDTGYKKCEYKIDVPDFDRTRMVSCLVRDMDSYKKLDRDYDIVISSISLEELEHIKTAYNKDFDIKVYGLYKFK